MNFQSPNVVTSLDDGHMLLVEVDKNLPHRFKVLHTPLIVEHAC